MVFAVSDTLQLTAPLDQFRVGIFESNLLFKKFVDLEARKLGIVVFTFVDFCEELDLVDRLLYKEADLHVVDLVLWTKF